MTATTAHATCDHQSTKKARANCRMIRAQVASYTALTDTELSAAMRAGTKVTGWAVYNSASLPEGVVKREITGILDYVQDSKSDPTKRIWTIRFQIDPTGKTCSPALESAGTYLTGNIRLAG